MLAFRSHNIDLEQTESILQVDIQVIGFYVNSAQLLTYC
jgi:hypothetical protein